MKTAQRWLLPLSLCVYAAAAPACASPEAILLEFQSPNRELVEVWKAGEPLSRRIEEALEFGDETEGSVLRLLLAEGDPARYRVSVQFETSMAISGEGPHIDLVDWKHCQSDWRPAEPVAGSGFRLPAPSDRDHSCFPHATREELREAVKRELDEYGWEKEQREHWLQLVRQVPKPGEQPSYVAISTVRVRIERLDDRGTWTLLTTIDFELPMGC